MRKVRILIVDDAVTSRRRLCRAIEADPGLELVGTASTAGAPVEAVRCKSPDIIVLEAADRGPRSSALDVLDALLAARPDVPVLVVGPSVRRGGPLTVEALHRGAAGCLHVPPPGDECAEATLGQVLRDKLHTLASTKPARSDAIRYHPDPAPLALPPPAPSRRAGPAEVVAIGVSTGGPDALAALAESLPASLPVPVLIVQHMPASFIASLAERLEAIGGLPAREARDGQPLSPGLWIAPGDYHMKIRRDPRCGLTVALDQGPPENLFRPAADVLFRSVARTCGPRALAVILTGMGKDGLEGCRDVRSAGGSVLAQDSSSSVVWGMPGVVAEAGLADEVLPLNRIASEILRRVGGGRPNAASAAGC